MPDYPEMQEQPNDAKKHSEFFDKIKMFFLKAVNDLSKMLLCFGRKSIPVLKIMTPSIILGLLIFVLLFWTGLGDMIGAELAVLIGPIPALLIIFFICFIPTMSPFLGPGLLIAIGAGLLTGEQIAEGAVKPILALAALLAIDVQFNGGFIPPNLALGENEPETINAGVPAIVFTRLVTIPVAVVLSCLVSFL